MRITVLIPSAVALVASVAAADTVKPENVNYVDGAIETPLADAPGDPARGREIMITKSEGNCIACHQVEALKDAPFHGEVGPPLNGVGEYRSEAELRGIVANAKQMFPGTVMPAFYKTSGYTRPGDGYTGKAAKTPMKPILSAQQIEDVVAFLKTLKDS